MEIRDVTDWKKEWKRVEFTDTIRIYGFVRGRSAANFLAYSIKNDNHYTIFLTDLIDIIFNCKLKNGIVSGTFNVVKRGRNLGIKLKGVEKADTNEWRKKDCVIPDYL